MPTFSVARRVSFVVTTPSACLPFSDRNCLLPIMDFGTQTGRMTCLWTSPFLSSTSCFRLPECTHLLPGWFDFLMEPSIHEQWFSRTTTMCAQSQNFLSASFMITQEVAESIANLPDISPVGQCYELQVHLPPQIVIVFRHKLLIDSLISTFLGIFISLPDFVPQVRKFADIVFLFLFQPPQTRSDPYTTFAKERFDAIGLWLSVSFAKNGN